MFKNLKEKLATQVTKTNQTLFSTILPLDGSSASRDPNTRTSSVASRDDNADAHRSRLDSASSDISQTTLGNTPYVSPSRVFLPPSDVELEHGDDDNDQETSPKVQQFLSVYNTKFTQLKNAYNEVERERDQLKNILQQQQDKSIRRQAELREQLKKDRQANEQLVSSHAKDIQLRDQIIQELTEKLAQRLDLDESDQAEIQSLREKNNRLETLLTRCKEAIKTHQEKQVELLNERDSLQEQLSDKQTVIESMINVRSRIPEHQAESASTLDTHPTQSEWREKYDEQSASIEQYKYEIQRLEETLSHRDDEHSHSVDTLRTEFENLANELHQLQQTKDRVQSLLDEAREERDMYKEKYEQQQEQGGSELLSSSATVEPQQAEFDAKLKELHDENDQLQSSLAELKNKLSAQSEEQELQARSIRIKELESDLQAKQSQIEGLEKQQEEFSRFKLDTATLTEQHEQTMNTLEALQRQSQQELAAKNEDMAHLKQQLSSCENKLRELASTNQHTDESQRQQEENYATLQSKLTHVLEEKVKLADGLQSLRVEQQTTESALTEARSEIERLQHVASLAEQENLDKDRQITERDERIDELNSSLQQSQESGNKLRKALQKMNESVKSNEQSEASDTVRLRALIEEHEQRSKDQEAEYTGKLRAMAKEMSTQIDEKEHQYRQHLGQLTENRTRMDDDRIEGAERRTIDAEQRALVAERQMSALQEQFQEMQLNHHGIVQDLRRQIENLTVEKARTTDGSSQTAIEDMALNHHGEDSSAPFIFEPTEIDYLREIVLAYMTGTDRITMAKVICAVLRYTEEQKSLVIEHEKLRQSRWINSTR